MLTYAGHEWITTSEACERLAPDVGHETLRNWYAPRNGATPRVRILRTPDGTPIKYRRECLLCWADVVEAEHATRTAPAGRHRNTRICPKAREPDHAGCTI